LSAAKVRLLESWTWSIEARSWALDSLRGDSPIRRVLCGPKGRLLRAAWSQVNGRFVVQPDSATRYKRMHAKLCRGRSIVFVSEPGEAQAAGMQPSFRPSTTNFQSGFHGDFTAPGPEGPIRLACNKGARLLDGPWKALETLAEVWPDRARVPERAASAVQPGVQNDFLVLAATPQKEKQTRGSRGKRRAGWPGQLAHIEF